MFTYNEDETQCNILCQDIGKLEDVEDTEHMTTENSDDNQFQFSEINFDNFNNDTVVDNPKKHEVVDICNNDEVNDIPKNDKVIDIPKND